MKAMPSNNMTQKDRDYVLGKCKCMIRQEIKKMVTKTTIIGNTYYEWVGTGEYHMVPCDIGDILK